MNETQEVIKVKIITAPKGVEELEFLINTWIAESKRSGKTFELLSVTPAIGITAIPIASPHAGIQVGGQHIQQVEVKTIIAVAASILYKIQVEKG